MQLEGHSFLAELAARRRFGMRPGLDSIRTLMRELGDLQNQLRYIHIAGTNGKGAVSAMLDSVLRAAGHRVGRYTSPHLVRINERFFIDGAPAPDDRLFAAAEKVFEAVRRVEARGEAEITFFEALTAVAFVFYADAIPDGIVVLETGLGGRLDATNIIEPDNVIAAVITRIGLDHCDWLGGTFAAIAAEKAGIIKAGRPIICGATPPEARAVIEAKAKELDARFVYAPDCVSDSDIPEGFSLRGSFNRENALTALAVLKTMVDDDAIVRGMSSIVWPGRYQEFDRFIVDGAHNPPAATALAAALPPDEKFTLIAGFCGDKDVAATLALLAPHVVRGIAVKTNNPRSLEAIGTSSLMKEADIAETIAAESLDVAISRAREFPHRILICGSLFLAGEALVALGAFPWRGDSFDPSEALRVT